MPTGFTNRSGSKGPHASAPLGVEKKLAKKPVKAAKEKFLLAKATALDKRAAAKVSHAERKANFEANRPLKWIKRKHPYTDCPPDCGSKATRERTFRNKSGDAKLMKADGHGLRHEGLPGDDAWKEKKVKWKKPIPCTCDYCS